LAIGFARAWSQPAATDAGFHLLRAGGQLFRGSLQAYAVPPGGEGAPLLGAIIAQLATLAPGNVEQILRVPGAIALAGCAMLLWFAVAKRAGVFAGIFAVVLLLLVPSFTSSFAARPDQALAGVLFLVALCAALESSSLAKQLTWTTLSAMASPFAMPAIVAFPFFAPSKELRSARSWIAPVTALAIFALLSIALPAGARSEIARGLLSGWGMPGAGFRSTARALAASPITAIILAIPLLAAAKRTAIPGVPLSIHLPFVTCMLATILFAKADAFTAFWPAMAPAACLLVALLAAAIPDRVAAPGALRRPLLFALSLPILAFVLESDHAQRRRNGERSDAARDAQVGTHLLQSSKPQDSIVAVSTGALAYFSERPVWSMERYEWRAATLVPPQESNSIALPKVVVFEKALQASRSAEIQLMREPVFLFSFAPYLFRRGPHMEFQDAVWLRRDDPFRVRSSADSSAPSGEISAEYVDNLGRGFAAYARNATDEAAQAFAAAAALSPQGLGIAQEWSGICEDRRGLADVAAVHFESALRDPATARARGYLADRAISSGNLARADSLLKQALAWNVDEPELWGTLARLQVERGELAEAKESSMRAIRMHPANARLLMNHGSILWRTGEQIDAKQLWLRAAQLDPLVRRILGKFEQASATEPAPPPVPLFSLAEFMPKRTARTQPESHSKASKTNAN
jgi:Tfp pilus assembly protein PilF